MDCANPAPKIEDKFELDRLLNEQQTARFLGVTTRCLQKWRLKGGGPKFVRISSRCIRYRRRELLAWANARLKSSTSEK